MLWTRSPDELLTRALIHEVGAILDAGDVSDERSAAVHQMVSHAKLLLVGGSTDDARAGAFACLCESTRRSFRLTDPNQIYELIRCQSTTCQLPSSHVKGHRHIGR